jgi:F420-dependent oxidoreductase-like protein
MRFGIFIPQGWKLDLLDIADDQHWATMRSLAQQADAAAWDSLWVFDHFHTVPEPTEEATHEAWTLMAAFAASTSRIRLGQMCTCMSYRPPAYLAKVAATVDHVSGGRAMMGIGSGWYEHEWRAYGYGFPATAERLGRLREGVEIMTQAWRDGIATLDGRYYQVDGAIVRPLPLQPGGIPLWIAGGGEKVTLKIAAQYADYTNFGLTIDEFVTKSDILRGHTDTFGRDFDSITRSVEFNVIIGDSEADATRRVDALVTRWSRVIGDAKAEEFAAQFRDGVADTRSLVGTVEQVRDRIADWRDKGVEYAIINTPEQAWDRTTAAAFEAEIMPALG